MYSIVTHGNTDISFTYRSKTPASKFYESGLPTKISVSRTILSRDLSVVREVDAAFDHLTATGA